MDNKHKRPNRFFSPAKRQLKQSGSNGDMEVSERSKRVKGLSSIGRAKENSQMGGGGGGSGGEEEEELPMCTGGAKRFKVHSKPLNDCNAIDHAAVPRKLRTSMMKRSRESLSPPLPIAKKLHQTPNGTQRPQINGAKKSKQKMKEGVHAKADSDRISKDEEEVAEALYALKQVFPDTKLVKSKVDQKASEAKSLPLPETLESPVLASDAPEEASTKCHKASISVDAINLPSSVEGSDSDAVKVSCLTESSVIDRPNRSANQKMNIGLSSISSPDLRISLSSKREHTDDIPSTVVATPEHPIELWPVEAIATKQEKKQAIKENEDNRTRLACIEGTSALPPGEGNNPYSSITGLSMVGSYHCELPRSSSSIIPAWLDSATSATKSNPIANGVSKAKVWQVNPAMVDKRKSLKKCATHVYISRFILEHRASEKKSAWPYPSDQIKQNGAKIGATATAANNPNGPRNGLHGLMSIGVKNGLNGIISIGGDSNGSDTGKNMKEVRTGIVKDIQSCDFLTLSTCSGGLGSAAAPTNDINHGGSKLVSSAQHSAPYLHPIMQHLSMPFSLHGRSSPYPGQLPVPASPQFKSTQHMSSSFYGPQHLIHTDPAKQLHQQQHQQHQQQQHQQKQQHQQHQQQQHQQQQQQMWAAHYMHGRNSTSNLPNWQNGKHDSPILIPCDGPSHLPSSSLRQEALSSKFPPNFQQPQQQQQQLFMFSPSSSSSSSRGKMHHQHHHHIPNSYDGGGGGFHTDGSSHLKLVCNADHS